MIKHAQSLSSLRTPMTVVALSILLSACGGGGDNSTTNTNAASSPGSRTGSSASGNSSASSQAAVNVNIGNNGATTTPGAAGGTPAGGGNPAAGAAGQTGQNAGNTAAPGNTPTAPATETPRETTDDTTPSITADAGSATPGNSQQQPVTPATPVQAVSDKGIRGDLLLAMLEQRQCSTLSMSPVRGPDGSYLSERMNGIMAYGNMGNYVLVDNLNPGFPTGYQNTLGCNYQRFVPLQPGQHTYALTYTIFGKVYRLPADRPFNFIGLEVPVNLTTDTLTLGAEITSPARGNLVADTPFSVGLADEIPFGVVKRWQAANPNAPANPHFQQLEVRKGEAANEVDMCWSVSHDTVKRLLCTSWKVPANWTRGQELESTRQIMQDDRSTYENETGIAYWQSESMSRSD